MGHLRNKAIPKNHFRKDWQERVRTWFEQPAQAHRRKVARTRKAARLFPRPTESLKPVVHPAGLRHNMKIRLGRGFTLEELKVRNTYNQRK
jgi:large subunit ribosomal protein L13e